MSFVEGQHGCPVDCRYCVITEVDSRREVWNQQTLWGINKAVTLINPPPDLQNTEAIQSFNAVDPELLRGDIVGFNGISDPFWPKYREQLHLFIDKVAPVAKIVTFVTKFDVPNKTLDMLATVPNARLIVSTTGLGNVERTTIDQRLDVLRRAKERGIVSFPIIHPYIAGLSDLSFLPKLAEMGYTHVDVKGLRYNPNTMNQWMPESSQRFYQDSHEQEILVEDGWREQIARAGLTLIPHKDWYFSQGELYPKLSRGEAERRVRTIMEKANVISSDSDQAVFEAAVLRRMR